MPVWALGQFLGLRRIFRDAAVLAVRVGFRGVSVVLVDVVLRVGRGLLGVRLPSLGVRRAMLLAARLHSTSF